MLQFQSLEEHVSELSAYYKNEALLWLRGIVTNLLLRRHGFALGLLNLGFVAYKLAIGQFLLGVLRFSPDIVFPPSLYMYVYIIWE
jgi:hypothetical protein